MGCLKLWVPSILRRRRSWAWIFRGCYHGSKEEHEYLYGKCFYRGAAGAISICVTCRAERAWPVVPIRLLRELRHGNAFTVATVHLESVKLLQRLLHCCRCFLPVGRLNWGIEACLFLRHGSQCGQSQWRRFHGSISIQLLWPEWPPVVNRPSERWAPQYHSEQVQIPRICRAKSCFS